MMAAHHHPAATHLELMERGQSKENHHHGFTGGDAHIQPEDQDSWDEDDAAGGARSPVAAREQQQEEDEEGFVLPPPCRGRQQLHAMLRRQWLSKKRGWVQTVMELISPLLMMSLIVWGWSKSVEEHFFMEFPVNVTLPVFRDEYLTPRSLLEFCPPQKLLSIQDLKWDELALAMALIKEADFMNNTNWMSEMNSTSNMTIDEFLKKEEMFTSAIPLSPVLLSLALKCMDTGTQVSNALKTFSQYRGPLPIPTFDGFVALHKLIQKVLVNNGQYEEAIRIQQHFGNMLGNLLSLGRITFAPNSSEVAGLVNHLTSETEFFREVYGGTFASEEEAVKSALFDTEFDSPIWAVVVVNQMDPLNGKVDYKIRMNFTTVPHTWSTIHKHRIGLLTYYKHYYTSGFLSLQDAINSYVFKLAPKSEETDDVLDKRLMWGAAFPVPAHSRNKFYKAVGPMLGLMMCLSTLYPLGMLVKGLVEEKETRAKETMYIMGLKPWVFSTSWLLTYMAVFFMVSLSVSSLLSVTIFPHSDLSILFLLFFLFTASLISFGFFLSVFFSKAKLAAIVAPFIHFGAIMPRYIFFRASGGQAIQGKSIAALLPPTAFTFGVDLVGHYEGAGFGMTWSNILEDKFSMAFILALLLIDICLYAALAWYLEQILPSEFGAVRSPWFLFSPSYWWSNRKDIATAQYKRLHADEEENSHTNNDNNNNIEPYLSDGHHQQPAVQIRDLRKVYSGGKVAVEGLTLDLYEDHITALLGHNGAGKSTTISMLTGLIRPSSGDALIWGHSIRQDMNNIRRTIGVCPQQNVLFNYLTVKEHLELFASLKGVPKLNVDGEVQDMVTRLGLQDKLHARASNLSGGMKRKLQMGLAMIGGSRVVFLDEPTSGLDPQSRRSVWELLQRFKAGRAIVLTTHYMDEADLLCDRIAIMSEGRLRCCGSSLFLKAKFGVGYNLSMTRSSIACNDSVVSDLVQRHVPEAVLLSSAGGEMTFQLPFTNKAAFAQLFQELEQQKEALHISGYGVSMTTLEEVFLSLAVDDQTSKNQGNVFSLDEAVNTIQEVQGFSYSRKSSESSFLRAFFEMFKKRVLIARRDLKGLINSVLLPVVVISFVMLILKLNIDPAGPELMLNFRMYAPTSNKDSPLKTIVPVVVGAPHSDDALSLLHGNEYLEYYAQDIGLKNSVQLSEQLLETYSLKPARFGALVFNDTLWPQLNTSALRNFNWTQLQKVLNRTKASSNWKSFDVNETMKKLLQTESGNGVVSQITFLFNTTSDHSLPALIQELAQARLQAAVKNNSTSFLVSSHPLPLTKNESLKLQTVLTVLAALFILIPFCYLSASFAVFVVRERIVKAKLLQIVSGGSRIAYWVATYTWDMIMYTAIVVITMLVFVAYQDQSFIGSWTKVGAVLALLMSFGASVIPLTYCYSFAFSNHANAQVAIAGIHFVTGFAMVVGSLVMGALDETKALNEKLMYLYKPFPPFHLGRGLVSLSALDLKSTVSGQPSNPYTWDVLGRPLTWMAAEAFGYLLLTLLIENDIPLWLWHSMQTYISSSKASPLRREDPDVSNERVRVETGLTQGDSVIMQHLWKVFPGRGLDIAKVAVKDLSIGIHRGECFGFLGVNGAGKTTTLSILSGDIKPTSGNASINGYSVLTQLTAARRQMGYCPQFDPLLDLMTAREHLHMYASLKGVPRIHVQEVVNSLVQAVGLQNYVDRVAGSYSGGNKRKLALAIALVGDPAVVFLDEPSSGMDPVSRRGMWNLITDSVSQRDMSVVLTTHSMEECEALCGRVGVMVAGTFVCLGSIQHVKSRFGQGYTVELRCKNREAIPALQQFMLLTFPGARLEEEHGTRVKYCLPMKDFSLSLAFSALEREKDRLGLEDYNVSQSTLEQVFLSLANGRTQEEEE
ncbi:unnamed protein product [Sphagnum balticum]